MAKTLLLADDSVTIQKVVGIRFASEDIVITTVDNGDDALVQARALRPDIILADVVMPGLTGYEVCEAVKADPGLAHIPVLLLTGTFEAFDEDRASRVGAAGHVAKPFEAQTLVERVKELVAHAPPPRPAPASIATPEPAPVSPPVAEAPRTDQAFDFFDEPAVAPAVVAPAPEPAPVASAADFDVEGPDGAFAFGEDELPSTSDVGADFASGAPVTPVAHTVAIIPESAHDSDLGDDLPPPVPEAVAPPAEDGFDFEFESVPAPPRPADLDVLADSAQLDPGTSAFDVSSSELDELSRSPIQPAAATQILSDAVDDDSSDISSPRMLAPDPSGPGSAAPGFDQEPAPDLLGDAPLTGEDPLEAGPIDSSAAFIEDLPTQAPGRSIDFAASEALPKTAGEAPDLWPSSEEALPPDDMRATALDDDFAVPEPIPEPESAPLVEPAPLAATPEPVSESVQTMADEALEQISPMLRVQLHETLEKIAWEAFGQVAETVVEQAVAQVEKVAWEVVPKLAETLIVEELRKLKGE